MDQNLVDILITFLITLFDKTKQILNAHGTAKFQEKQAELRH
jgi:hypothetical protein